VNAGGVGPTIVGVIRALVVGAAEGAAGLAPLPPVLPAVRALVRALSRFDGIELVGGAPVENPGLHTANRHWTALREDGADAAMVFFSGHGLARGKSLYLPVSGTDPARLPDTAIPLARWLDEIEDTDDAVPTLFVLDVCQAGTAALYQSMQETLDRDRKTWVIAACAPTQAAFGARFTTAFATVLDDLRAGGPNTWPRTRHVPLSAIARKVDQELARLSGDEALPQTVFRTPEFATVQEQPFFPDPGFTEDRAVRMRQLLDAGLREMTDAVLARAPGLDPVHFFTRVSGTPPGKPYSGSCFFTGRTAELRTMADWMRAGPQLLTVTGSPGAGKSALLGALTCLCHPQMRELSATVRSRIPAEVRPSAGSVPFAAVHARFRAPAQVIESLTVQLGLEHDDGDPWTVDGLVERLTELAEAPVLVVDAVDESWDSRRLVREVLLPLLAARAGDGRPVCRMVIGVRPWWDRLPDLYRAASRGRLIDLDSSTPPSRLAEELTTYIDDLLGGLMPGYDRSVAEALGERLAVADGRFLLASLFVDHLARNLPPAFDRAVDMVPADLPGMFRMQLDSSSNPCLPAVLSIVARAKGQGMPLELIHRCTRWVEEHTTLEQVRDALSEAGFYLRLDADPDGLPLYRFYHQSLDDHFGTEGDDRSLLDGLLDVVPLEGRTRAWWQAPSYLLRHVLDHAVDAGRPAVDGLLLDAGLLVHADPRSVVRSLDAAVSAYAQRQASVYASSFGRTSRLPPAQRKQVLALDAVRQGRRDLAGAFWAVPTDAENPPLRFRWATGPERVPNLLLTVDPATVEHVTALAAGHSGDRPVVLIGGSDGTVDVHDARDGAPLLRLRGHDEPLVAIETVDLDDVTFAVTGSASRVCVWDLADGSLYREYTDAGLGLVALGIGKDSEGEGLLGFLATASGTLRYVDLDTGERRDETTGLAPDIRAVRLHTEDDEQYLSFVHASGFTAEDGMTSVALGAVDGADAEIVGDRWGQVHVWDRGTGDLLHSLVSYDRGYVMKTRRWPSEDGSDATVRILRDQKGGIPAVALGCLRGLPVAVAAQENEYVRVWDLGYRCVVNPLGSGLETALRLTRAGAEPAVLLEMSAFDRPALNRDTMRWETVRQQGRAAVWSRADGEWIPDAETDSPPASSVTTWDGRTVEVTSGEDGVVRVRDTTSGETIGGPLYLPADFPRRVILAADEQGAAVYWAHEVAVLDWAGGDAAESPVPVPETTHVIAWFPGGLLADQPGSEIWDVFSKDAWVDGESTPILTIGAPQDVDPEVLERILSAFLEDSAVDVVSLERSTYGVSPTADGVLHEFPLFLVTTIPRPPGTQDQRVKVISG
jgi:WD40 repeat protein